MNQVLYSVFVLTGECEERGKRGVKVKNGGGRREKRRREKRGWERGGKGEE